MTIDTKTTAGGVVILFLSGTGGYLATNAAKGETTSLSQERSENSDTKHGKALRTDQKGNEEVSATIKEEMSKGKFGDDASKESDCVETLEKPYKEADFKDAILKCFKTKKFRDRAIQLSIQLIEDETNKDNLFSERTSNLGNPSVLKIAQDTAAKGIQTGTGGVVIPGTLPDFCKKVGDLTWFSKKGATYSIEKEWDAYLKGCAKKTSLKTNFWTGK